MHFSLRFVERQWRLDDLGSTDGTWINGVRAPRAVLQHADRIRAGGCVFAVQLGGQTLPSTESTRDTATARPAATAPSQPASAATNAGDSVGLPIGQGFVSTPVGDLARRAQLGEEAAALAGADDKPGKYLTVLLEQGLLLDAIRFLGQALPRRDLVQWAAHCVRAAEEGTLSAGDGNALQLAEAWAENPGEDVRAPRTPPPSRRNSPRRPRGSPWRRSGVTGAWHRPTRHPCWPIRPTPAKLRPEAFCCQP